MQLLSYISTKMADPKESKGSRDAFKGCAKALGQFLSQSAGAPADVDLLRVLEPGWAESYVGFLHDGFESRKKGALCSPEASVEEKAECRRRAAANQLTVFRRLMRNATEEGLLPNVDVLEGVAGFSRRKNVAETDLDAEIRRFILKGTGAMEAWVDRYVLSLLLCGVPLGALPAVAAQAREGSIKLPHLPIELYPEPELQERLMLYASGRGAAAEPDTAAGDSKTAAEEQLSRLAALTGPKVDRAADTFTDWLILARQSRKPEFTADDIRQLVSARYASPADIEPALADKVRLFAQTIARRYLTLQSAMSDQYWFAIKTYGRTAEDFSHQLHDMDQRNDRFHGKFRNNIFCPCRKGMTSAKAMPRSAGRTGRKGRPAPERAVLRDLLFVRTTDETIQWLEQAVPNIWVFQAKKTVEKKYSHVSAAELHNMQKILNYVTDYTDVEVLFEPQPEQASEIFLADQRVRVMVPGYDHYDAVIATVDKKRTTPVQTYYIIAFDGDNGMRFRMSVPEEILSRMEQRV